MACLVDKLAAHLNKEVTAKGIWNHLSTMYNLAQLVSDNLTFFLIEICIFNKLMFAFLGIPRRDPLSKH
jgi:hypothetical protein